MTLKNRIEIAIKLKNNESIRNIAKSMGISHTTILREIKKYKSLVKNTKVLEIKIKSENEIIKEHPCDLLTKSPYVCNGCSRYINNHCTYHYVVYSPELAYEKYRVVKTESNSVFILNKEELILEIQRGLDLGQPISHIIATLDEKYMSNSVSHTTIYNWINKGLLIYKKKLIKRTKEKIHKEQVEYKRRQDFLEHREYKKFLEYIKDKNIEVCEMDLLCGKKGTNGYILTMFIPRIQFFMAYKLNNKMPSEVIRVLDNIESKIGLKMFRKLFGVILTDRGSEFLKYKEIEYSRKTLKRRTKIFYCDAGSPTQKSRIENIHRLVRKVYGKNFNLENVTQEDLYEVASNINSLKKKRYNNKTPNDLFLSCYSKTLLNKLSLRVYLAEEVVLKSSSIKV